ncbi:MAG: GerW family sporulation protein [Clostridia bacterium]|nr:GerW family sporulation protein [Clostridia bacterium]
MSDNKIQAILDTTMDKLKAMVNADVITGDPIIVDGLTLIPVSKVAYGIATGGSDFATKNQQGLFGGGSGAGVTVSPIAFMVIKDGNVKMVPIYNELTTLEKAVTMAPEIIDKAKEIFTKDKEN